MLMPRVFVPAENTDAGWGELLMLGIENADALPPNVEARESCITGK